MNYMCGSMLAFTCSCSQVQAEDIKCLLLPKHMNYNSGFFHTNPTLPNSPALLLVLLPTGCVPQFPHLERGTIILHNATVRQSHLNSLGVILCTKWMPVHIQFPPFPRKHNVGLPWRLRSSESACRRPGLIPESRRSPGEGNG